MSKERQNTYTQAQTDLQKAKDVYNTTAKQDEENYRKQAEESTGEKGYLNALELAQKGAEKIAQSGANLAQQQARKSGLSKGQAAALASANAFNTMGNALQGQQATAQNQLANQLNTILTGRQLATSSAQDVANLGQSAYGLAQQNVQNILNNISGGMDIAGKGLNAASSIMGMIPGL